ncbi:MAG: hypothetical protein A3J07_00235 [Candidatus Doudnabacteria bacterium RIFCSPLOWO2_02_FULL_49_13]|uniref:Uncharacterized protein n=1 Tax=Candidatus Doudnabacteria bacterium RIFCSPHIGHO2_12_FULL_48_16 TaxID=1817838 RepID=A0A1F5PIV3_9BACT|nr:MAG: hypothetical protein A3B77_00125 [Candidatus Doudnabacteria bacterium RIFCSPHIGHO2_02_FULL_49_24]OGE89536.1 MAG: hypothetical protein A2760_03385 [Candidatus Doudnabacteria bacterium RIFCSPHIGHO2_01_FULL_50_67]OGE89787.1 MAG: hypothetical protein A3E29_00155 [Candidatus Doudnabacteria bacterium RIFCSPHIGHO2_12_FULL_48_16]OGE97691.1 MAG: hypothetical protein A2990_00635 [Candidatus Doudnabacteria bacterium RIFCSPLOWO2_01_FULL_49_40]OGF02790.1 MAG: hypothetical protein A3J07_00235 [Candid
MTSTERVLDELEQKNHTPEGLRIALAVAFTLSIVNLLAWPIDSTIATINHTAPILDFANVMLTWAICLIVIAIIELVTAIWPISWPAVDYES